MEENIKRTRSVQVRLTQEEYEYLEKKFLLSGYKSKSEFMRILLTVRLCQSVRN
ncbi:hypothetical protein [Ruminococcus sp.]|uniref:plasmid mobilization protein n=1 Tax=Ruminococcus sp. TaxID=41978 RepID=UPI0025D10795|nr:hypothetical protein [Ruminococcus sp.]MBQ8966718.1 hypothetical protein [Ruminococcus sp.]